MTDHKQYEDYQYGQDQGQTLFIRCSSCRWSGHGEPNYCRLLYTVPWSLSLMEIFTWTSLFHNMLNEKKQNGYNFEAINMKIQYC